MENSFSCRFFFYTLWNMGNTTRSFSKCVCIVKKVCCKYVWANEFMKNIKPIVFFGKMNDMYPGY
jgi:hypothetical protein